MTTEALDGWRVRRRQYPLLREREFVMGDLYFVQELNDEAVRWINTDWIECSAMPRPAELTPQDSLPTLGQLKSALAAIPSYRTTYREGRKSLDVEVVHEEGYDAGWSTTIWVESASREGRSPRSDDEAVRLTFQKGSPELAALITERLTRECGPLLLISANDGIPLIVFPGIDLEQALVDWENGWAGTQRRDRSPSAGPHWHSLEK